MLKNLTALFITLLLSSTTIAQPIPGTRISYQHLNGDSYLIKVIFYWDCSTILPPTFVKVCFSSDSCSVQDSIMLPVTVQGVQLPPFNLLPFVTSSCNGGSGFGVEKWTYSDTLQLPFQCTDWILSYSNAEEYDWLSATYYPNYFNSTKINNKYFQDNSSIEINTDPGFQYCVAQMSYINFSATDIDGDSLVYQLDSVQLDSQQCPLNPIISIFPNYIDYLNAIYPFVPVSVDPQNGLMSFIPPYILAGMVSVSIHEFRNGIKINSTLVQQQVYVVSGCINSSLNENTESTLTLSPNPATNVLELNLYSFERLTKIFITNNTGQPIKNLEIHDPSIQNYNIDVSDIPSGMYTISAISSKSIKYKKFIKL